MSRNLGPDPTESFAQMNLETTKISLAEQCYEHIRKLILDGEIEAGSRFNEKELIERVGFGRTPVREALARLDMEGIIQTMPRAGYVLSKIDLAAIEDHFLVWRFVGPKIVRKAAENITEDEKSLLERYSREMSAGTELDEWLRVSAIIFDILTEATQSPNLTYINRRLSCQMHRIYGLYFRSEHGERWLRDQSDFFLRGDWTADPELAELQMKAAIRHAYIEIREMIAAAED